MTKKIEKYASIVSVSFIAMILLCAPAKAATTYSDRTVFSATLGSTVTDDYENLGYAAETFDNASMSAVLGETDYTATGFLDNNIVRDYGEGNRYCSGCNGTFELGFTTTSVGNSDGVFGVGFNYRNNITMPFLAFVTFGDGSTGNFSLLNNNDFNTFFGITSDLLIQSIHLGFLNGSTSTIGQFQLDNLTLGSVSVIPLPASLPLYGAGLVLLGLLFRRQKPSVKSGR